MGNKKGKIDKNKLKMFMDEIRDIENKYGFKLSADYEEEIDYGFDGDGEYPYVVGVTAFVTILNRDGEQIMDDFRGNLDMSD